MDDDIDIRFDESGIIRELQVYVKELRAEYDQMRNDKRKLEAKVEKVKRSKERVLTQIEMNRQACELLSQRRHKLNQEHGGVLDELEKQEHRRKAWGSIILPRTRHNNQRLKQRCEITSHEVEKAKQGLQLAWKVADQAKKKLVETEVQKQQLLQVRVPQSLILRTRRCLSCFAIHCLRCLTECKNIHFRPFELRGISGIRPSKWHTPNWKILRN